MNTTILFVEDNAEDAAMTIQAFESVHHKNPLIHCQTGDEALDYLYRRGPYEQPGTAARPGFILLDLNLPGTDGREVLTEIKQDQNLRTIPVVVLTTSSDEKDVADCYRCGANSYITKPIGINGFREMIARLQDYWFDVAAIPRQG